MVIKAAIFKISGKILDNSKHLINTIAQLTQLYEDNILQKIILIPGGGTLANFVRNLYLEFKIDDELAHWIAIYSMNFNGLELQLKFPHLEIIEDFEFLKNEKRIFSIFLPYKYLRLIDPLPHSWDVTSDSISLYCAHKLGLNECFLIKDVDGVLDINNNVIRDLTTKKFIKLKKEGDLAKTNAYSSDIKEQSKPIDAYLTKLIDLHKVSLIILNGVSPNLRILKYFSKTDQNNKIYSKINFE
ncbi:MAG: hypothetical protein ACFFDX_04805 [Candidatus Odinarchaeota archaeon]